MLVVLGTNRQVVHNLVAVNNLSEHCKLEGCKTLEVRMGVKKLLARTSLRIRAKSRSFRDQCYRSQGLATRWKRALKKNLKG